MKRSKRWRSRPRHGSGDRLPDGVVHRIEEDSTPRRQNSNGTYSKPSRASTRSRGSSRFVECSCAACTRTRARIKEGIR